MRPIETVSVISRLPQLQQEIDRERSRKEEAKTLAQKAQDQAWLSGVEQLKELDGKLPITPSFNALKDQLDKLDRRIRSQFAQKRSPNLLHRIVGDPKKDQPSMWWVLRWNDILEKTVHNHNLGFAKYDVVGKLDVNETLTVIGEENNQIVASEDPQKLIDMIGKAYLLPGTGPESNWEYEDLLRHTELLPRHLKLFY